MNLPAFRRKILLPSSALKMVNFSSSTRRYFREESNMQVCLCSLEEGRETVMLCVRVIFSLCFSSGWIIFRHVSFSIYLFIYFIGCIISGYDILKTPLNEFPSTELS
jgi:hypothetical protein